MDEMWQRHKSFILQLSVIGIVFLVAFLVMRSMYGDYNDPERARVKNAARLSELQSKASTGHAPSADSIATQRDIAKRAETTKRELVKHVASVAGRDDKSVDADREKAYVRENIAWVLANIGRQNELATYEDLFAHVPQACLSRLRDAARSALVSKAAQSGKAIDETNGVSAGYAEDEIPAAIHGLAIVTEIVGRGLAKSGIDSIQSVRVTPHSTFPEVNGVNFVSAIGVHLEMVGDPVDINELLRSFNSVGKPDVRQTVVESVEYVVPMGPDEDTVKASINVVGLRLKAEMQAEGK
jgi:hypothetical protein